MMRIAESADTEKDTDLTLAYFFESAALAKSPSSSKSYLKALRSLQTFLRSRDLSLSDEENYGEWLINLWRNGTTYATVRLYLDIVASLTAEAATQGLLSERVSKEVSRLRTSLREAGENIWTRPVSTVRLTNLIRLLRTAARLTADYSKATDLLLLTILIPGKDAATVTVAEAKEAAAQAEGDTADEIEAIIARQSNPRRKFLFDLNQSRQTPRQLTRETQRLLTNLAIARDIPDLGSVQETADTVRVLVALDAGISTRDTLNAIDNRPASLPVLDLLNKGGDKGEDGEETEVESQTGRLDRRGFDTVVATTLLTNPLRWFAMRMRPGVTLDSLQDRLDMLGDRVTTPTEYFYPHEEIAKRTGRKLVFRQRPFINDVVFIRSRRTDLGPLFAGIGDMAWCYTMSGRPGSPYAAIPQAEFTRFQTTIGRFTSDTDLHPLDTLTPLPGEPVIFLSGPFRGKEATLESTQTLPPPKEEETKETNKETATKEATQPATILYRLRIIGDNGLEWRVTADSREVRPLTKKQST